MRPTKALISIHAVSPSSMHRTSAAVWMNIAASSIRSSILAPNTTITTPNKNSINTIPDSKTRRERLFYLLDSRLSRHQEGCLSTTRLHPSFLFLSSMLTLDPRPFPPFTRRLLARPATLDKNTTDHKDNYTNWCPSSSSVYPIHGCTRDNTHDKKMKGNSINASSTVLPPFTMIMFHYKEISSVWMMSSLDDSERNSDMKRDESRELAVHQDGLLLDGAKRDAEEEQEQEYGEDSNIEGDKREKKD